jgi:hypothetical protein
MSWYLSCGAKEGPQEIGCHEDINESLTERERERERERNQFGNTGRERGGEG